MNSTQVQRDTARALRIDTVTGEVLRGLGAAGVPSIVIKGPAVARTLYDDGAPRLYGDSDVLVPHSRLDRARGILRELGFQEILDSTDVPSGVSYHHASPWVREARDYVDLHWSIWFAGVEPERVWEALAPETETERVGGAEAAVPNAAATALLAALHRVGHGAAAVKPSDDLERALTRLPRDAWERAAALAAGIDALDPFAAGLRMDPRGAALADELDLPRPGSVRLAILTGGGPGTAHGIETLAQTPGVVPRARTLARAVAPSRAYMRVRYRWAQRGPGWLALAYLYRPFWLARRALPSIRAWRRARREMRTLDGCDGS